MKTNGVIKNNFNKTPQSCTGMLSCGCESVIPYNQKLFKNLHTVPQTTVVSPHFSNCSTTSPAKQSKNKIQLKCKLLHWVETESSVINQDSCLR